MSIAYSSEAISLLPVASQVNVSTASDESFPMVISSATQPGTLSSLKSAEPTLCAVAEIGPTFVDAASPSCGAK